jgi:excisionase family DNA binding protein
VFTLADAAAYLRVDEAAVLGLIDTHALPARRVGAEWRLLKSAVDDWLSQRPPITPGKAAQLAVAGSWKDDPLVDEELRETHRRRGRQESGDGP